MTAPSAIHKELPSKRNAVQLILRKQIVREVQSVSALYSDPFCICFSTVAGRAFLFVYFTSRSGD